MKIIRSVIAVLAGLIVLTVVGETIEYVITVFIYGADSGSNESYFGIRNQPLNLVYKLIYNFLCGMLGGVVAVKIASNRKPIHGYALASIQLISFIWAMTDNEMRSFAPLWAWVSFTVVTVGGIITGARLAVRSNLADATK